MHAHPRSDSLPAPQVSSDLVTVCSRNERWIQACGLGGRRAHALPGCSYRELRARGEVEAPTEAIVQIDKDVPRTFGELDAASAIGCRVALRAALLAFVVHEPTLGYCQGMHLIAGAALLPAAAETQPPGDADEERAFLWLSHVVHALLPDFFAPGLQGLLEEQALLARLLEESVPELPRAFERLNISLGLLTSSWWLSLFQQPLGQQPNFGPRAPLNDGLAQALEAVDELAAGTLTPLQLALRIMVEAEGAVLAAEDGAEVLAALHAACAARGLVRRATAQPMPDAAAVRLMRGEERAALSQHRERRQVRRALLDAQRATHLDAGAVATLQTALRRLCTAQRHDAVDAGAFARVAQTSLGSAVDAPSALRLFAALDVDGAGRLPFHELASALSVLCKGGRDERAALCFRAWDLDGSGFVAPPELRRMLASMHALHYGAAPSERELASRVAQILEHCDAVSPPPLAPVETGAASSTSPSASRAASAHTASAHTASAYTAYTAAGHRSRAQQQQQQHQQQQHQYPHLQLSLDLRAFQRVIELEPRLVACFRHERAWAAADGSLSLGAATPGDGRLSGLLEDASASPFRRPRALTPSRAPRWVPDAHAASCRGCFRDFGMLRRRHHCRSCGEVFCDECTKARLMLPHLGYDDPVRACEQCVASRALILASASAASAPGLRPPGCGGGAAAPSTAASRGANVRHGEWF